jgi:translation initiation factor 5A
MSEKKPTEIKLLRTNGFVLIDDVPCQVTDISISKSGKHGAAKARLVAVGVFDHKKRTIVAPGDSRVDIPVIEKRTCQVIALIGDNAQLMDTEDFGITEVPIPEELKPLKEGDEVLVWRYGQWAAINSKK